jgi:hypothetical protein
MTRHQPLDLRVLLLAAGVLLGLAVLLSRCLAPTPPPPPVTSTPYVPTVVVVDPTRPVALPPTAAPPPAVPTPEPLLMTPVIVPAYTRTPIPTDTPTSEPTRKPPDQMQQRG